jgi:aminopeptidase N
VKERSEDFYFPLAEQPQVVRIDPNLSVLGRINFKPANAMLHAMLADKSDVVGRFVACEQLQEKKDREAVNKLKEALNNDPFWGVRVMASRGLRAINTDEAFDALAASMKQSDARVRKQVVSDVTSHFRPAAFDHALAVLKSEKNPDIVAVALRALDSATNETVRALLIEQLNSDSFRQHLADTAISTIRARNDPAYIEPLRAAIAKRAMEFPSRTLSGALDTLAYLAREFIQGFANHQRQSVKLAAINALGTLRDDRALPVLERYASALKNSPERSAAERAIESIRSARRSNVDLGDLRREVLELQKQNRELRKDLDALKKKADATVPAKPAKK